MCGSMVDNQSPTAEIRRGKKGRKIETTGQKYNGLPYYIGDHKKYHSNMDKETNLADKRYHTLGTCSSTCSTVTEHSTRNVTTDTISIHNFTFILSTDQNYKDSTEK